MIQDAPLHLFQHLDLAEQDKTFDAMHPGVFRQFVGLADQVRAAGLERYSADALLHRLRWHYQVERGEGEWKCNNNWTAYLARRLLREREEFLGFFETRRTRHRPGVVV